MKRSPMRLHAKPLASRWPSEQALPWLQTLSGHGFSEVMAIALRGLAHRGITLTARRAWLLRSSEPVVRVAALACAAATDDRIKKAVAVDSLASWVSDVPYEKQRLGLMLPGVLRDVGDVGHIAALAAPRKVLIVGGVGGDGKELTLEQLKAAYSPAKAAVIEGKLDATKVIEKLK